MDIKDQIIHELYKTLKKLGAGSEILSVVGSFGDTLSDEEVLEQLKVVNCAKDRERSLFMFSLKPAHVKLKLNGKDTQA
jgi:hypothetical protein